MTALPKRKPARRPTMAKPEPEPEPRPAPSWEQLTAPLDTSAPVILTPAALCEWDHLADELREQWGPDGIRAFNDASEALGCQRTYGPCLSRELAMASAPKRLPSERLFPAMMP